MRRISLFACALVLTALLIPIPGALGEGEDATGLYNAVRSR